MNGWLRRVRGGVGMGLTWAVVWAPVAVVIGTVIVDPDNSMDEMWWMVGAIPGFLSGVVFSAVLHMAAGRRKLDELSIARVARWGALAGLLIGILPFLLGDRGGRPVLPLAAVVITSFTLLSALSAAASLALAQRGQQRDMRDAGVDAADVGLAGGGLQALSGDTRWVEPAAPESRGARAPQHAPRGIAG